MSGGGLTTAQHAALSVLADLTATHATATPRQVAERLWPDSPAWQRRTRGRRTGTQNGAVGGTMPMLATAVLWRLDARGCTVAPVGDSNGWALSDLGRQVLAGTAKPHERPVRETAPPPRWWRKPGR